MKDDSLCTWLSIAALWVVSCALVGCRQVDPAGQGKVSRQPTASPSQAPSALRTPLAQQVVPSAAKGESASPGRTGKCWDAELVNGIGSSRPSRLLEGDAIRAEIENALAGKPRRITIDVHTSVTVDCACPFFVLDADDVGYAFLHPEYQGDVGRAVAWSVRGTYRLTGYYSGRLINTYQHINEHLGPGESPVVEGSGDDEQRSYWPERHPEFCIESWCFVPGANWKGDPRTENQPMELAEMRRLGGRVCK